KASAIKQKSVVRVRSASGDRELAQYRNVNVRIETEGEFPIREGHSVRVQGLAQLEQGIRGADLLQREHVGFKSADRFTNFGFAFRALGRSSARADIKVVVEVVRGHAESRSSYDSIVSGADKEESDQRVKSLAHHGARSIDRPARSSQ